MKFDDLLGITPPKKVERQFTDMELAIMEGGGEILPNDVYFLQQELEQKFENFVSESFDQPYSLTWEKGDFGDIDAYTTLPDGTQLNIMFNKEDNGLWFAEFHRDYSQDVTGAGDAQRIFATVLTAIQKFVKKVKPKQISFSAVKEADPTGSRSKLYDRLVQRYASGMGYSVERHTGSGKVSYDLISNVKENFADGKNPGRKGLAKRVGVNCKQPVSKLRSIAKNSSGERQRMAHWCANMKSGRNESLEVFEDYDTIWQTLKQAGYEELGSGADATVWAKDAGSVIKIIVPEEEGTLNTAAETFKKFYEFCMKHQNIECLPKFIPIQGRHYAEFTIKGETFIQISMERLYPLKNNSFQEAMVWYLSDFAVKNTPWEEVKKFLSTPAAWQDTDFGPITNQLALKVSNLKGVQEAKYALLYTVMTLLYHTGRINRLGWDLHTENAMQRRDGTVVIIDPWFNHEKD